MSKMTQSQLQDWNDTFPIGSPCRLILDDGSGLDTETRSAAWNLGHGQTVVMVAGKSGGWDLDRVKMMETHKP